MNPVVYLLDNIPFKNYNVYVSDSSNLFDKASVKENQKKDWSDEHGYDIDLQSRYHNSKTITVDCFIHAKTLKECIEKYNDFYNALDKKGSRRLSVIADILRMEFQVFRQDTAENKLNYDDSNAVGTFKLKLIENMPVKRILKSYNQPFIKLFQDYFDEYLNNIQISGRNLLKESQKYNNEASIWYTPNGSLIIPSVNGMIIGDSVLITPMFTTKLIDGENYTISFDFMSSTPSRVEFNSNSKTIIDGNGKKVRVHLPFKYNALNNSTTIYFRNEIEGSSCVISNIKFEKGNKATDWTPAPEDVQSEIDKAKASAEQALKELINISSDDILSAVEKQTLIHEWNRIKTEYTSNYALAQLYGIVTRYYVNAYNDLNYYISPMLVDLNSNSSIIGEVFRQRFKLYYDKNLEILVAVNESLKQGIDDNSQNIGVVKQTMDRINQITSFLNTTVNGNVIGTGVLMVGSESHSNAGISGLNESGSKSVRIWAGGTAQNRDKARWQILDDGTEVKYHDNGKLAYESYYLDGFFIENYYHKDGYLMFKLDPNRGLVNVAYSDESWTLRKFRKLNAIDLNISDSILANEISLLVTYRNSFHFINEDKLNYNCYEYHNGTLPNNSTLQQYNGYKIDSADKLNNNIPTGWYIMSSGPLFYDYATTKPVVTVVFIEAGVEKNNRNIILTNI